MYYVICIAIAVAVGYCIALPLQGRNAQFSIATAAIPSVESCVLCQVIQIYLEEFSPFLIVENVIMQGSLG